VLLLGIWSAAGAQTYRISGVVLNTATGKPAPRIRVAIAPSDARDREMSTVSGADGRFLFAEVNAGKYHLTADHPIAGRETFGQPEGAAAFGTAVVAGPGLKTEDLVFRLHPPSAIHGRLTDQGGDAIEGALVQLFRSLVVRGRRTTYYWGSRYTDDLGEYRFGPLPAGAYYILATGRPWYTSWLRGRDSGGPLSSMSYAPLFFPGSRDARGAAPVRLRAGQDVQADVAMTALPAGKLTIAVHVPGEETAPDETPAPVRGRVRPRPGANPARVDVTLEGPAGGVGWERVETIYGSSVLPGIPQGRCGLRVQTTDAAKPLYGRTTIDVGAGETKVDIALAEPPSVTGTVHIEGTSSAIPRGTLIELENDVENRHIRRPVADDGTFSFDTIPPGQYTPLLISPAVVFRLGSVAVGGAVAKDLWVDVTRPVRLDVTAVAKAAEVSGYVYRNGEAQAGVLAMLVPREESSNPYDYLPFQTDSDGSFAFTGVRPGDYTIFALTEFADFEYANPAAVRPYRPSGQHVHVESEHVRGLRLELKE